MKITINSEINDFLLRCEKNMQNDEYNQFLNVNLKATGYEKVVTVLKEIDYPELSDKEVIDGFLYYPVDDFLASPFHQKIHFENIQEADVKLEWLELEADVLFNFSGIQSDPQKELKDWIQLRALDKPLKTLSLSINDEIWMLDVPSESSTIDPCALKASGNVLTFGLGIGYFVYMASLNKSVKSITVVEENQRVIELFNKYILPQFNLQIDFSIIEGNAFDYFNEEFLTTYDYTFVDIYQSSDDGLEMEMKLLEQYNPSFNHLDFWIENSIFEVMPALMVLWIQSMQKIKEARLANDVYQTILNKIDAYFQKSDIVINSVNQLKELLYDTHLHRTILSTKTNVKKR